LTISNCFVRPAVGTAINYIYLDIIRNLKLLHNTFIYSNSSDGTVINNARRVLKVVGNLFVNGYNAALSISFPAAVNGATYTRSLAQDFQEEHDNVFVSEEGGYDHILALYGVENGSDILVRKSNTWSGAILDVDYRINYPGYGVNSKFQDTDIITLTTRTNPDTSTSEVVYLGSADSVNVGRNMISASLADEAAYDAGGFERLYPTDAGAYDRDATTAAGVSVTISHLSPLCRLNNCNDNASCTVRYNVVTTNAPAGSYIDVVKTSGDGTVSVVNSNPASAVIARNESTTTAPATFFTLQLKNSGGVVIASYNTSIGHQSFWQYLPLCS